MSERVVALARRIENDSYFLAPVLAVYASSEGLADPALANVLKCEMDTLVLLRLCRCPSPESHTFRQDVLSISTRFNVDAGALAGAIRMAITLEAFRLSSSDAQTLMAARDRDEQGSTDDEEEHRQ